MRKSHIPIIALFSLILTGCSPRDFLTRRLAADLIAASPAFKAQQQAELRTGIFSNDDYLSPDTEILQHHGWISANPTSCPAGISPAPCWNVVLTPSGVETIRVVAGPQEGGKTTFTIPVRRRQLLGITGISKQGHLADVEFVWKWVPVNEIGAALYAGEHRHKSVVGFRDYDDGWRVIDHNVSSGQSLEEALKDSGK